MILPAKHISLSRSYLGNGASLLNILEKPKTVSDLWFEMRNSKKNVTFDNFVLSLDFLFIIGAVDFSHEGLIIKTIWD